MTATLIAAAQIGLARCRRERELLLESCCPLDADLQPRIDTLSEEDKPFIAELDGEIAAIEAALKKAGAGQKPGPKPSNSPALPAPAGQAREDSDPPGAPTLPGDPS